MSWLFSRALVAEYSGENSSGGEPCAPLNVMPTAQPFLRRGKTTARCPFSLFGLTLEVLTATRGEELLTLFLEDSRARTSVLREMARESTESEADFGPRCSGSFVRYNLNLSSWKTPQLSLVEDLGEYLETWPRSGTMQNGECWERTPLERRTNASASGFLRTLPTITVHGNYNRKGMSKNSGDGLATALRKYPTLTANDAKNCGSPSRKNRNTEPLDSIAGGPLNPTWCEWFMGFPFEWTASEPLETDKFQQWLQAHGVSCMRDQTKMIEVEL